MRPVDMTKLGLLYLASGAWNGQRVLSADWVRKSFTAHTKMPARGGAADYGYYFWLYPERKLFEAWGGAGQRIGMFPELGVVVVMTASIERRHPPVPVRKHDLRLCAAGNDVGRRGLRAVEPTPYWRAPWTQACKQAISSNERGAAPSGIWNWKGGVSEILRSSTL
jgi:CubicO group peptidase (beta-lactamase class C family)